MSSHHDYIIEITAQHDALKPFAPENGQPLRFKIGDAVIYTNEFGAQFRRRVTGFYQPTGLSGLYARGARCAASRLRRLAPSGLPSFPRSARLTPQARIPRSGPARFACRAVGVWGRPLPCPAVFPDSITLSATVARGRVPSRRAGPCPRLRLRAAPTLRLPP